MRCLARYTVPVFVGSMYRALLLMCVGNDNLHLLTSDTPQRLRVDLADFRGNSRYAEYDNFAVGSVDTKYKLVSLGTYNGTAGQYDGNCTFRTLSCVK